MREEIDFEVMETALEHDDYSAVNDVVSRKAWKQLKRIREVDPEFVPSSEYDIWTRLTIMGMD